MRTSNGGKDMGCCDNAIYHLENAVRVSKARGGGRRRRLMHCFY